MLPNNAGMKAEGGGAPSRYEIRGEAGRGGVGIVFDAWDRIEDRQVALKMLGTRLLANEVALKRFQREAEVLARLDHPHIVKVHRTDVLDGQVVLDMEFIHGRPLSYLLQQGPLDAVDVVTLLRQVLDALAQCHDKGVVHCDLKPGNILITPTGHAYISDFGIARITLNDPGAVTELSGPLWGTPAYCPPELWQGGRATPAWDIYALGVMAYECLAGAPPFGGENPSAVMHQVLQADPARLSTLLPDVSQELADLIEVFMARDPAKRPADGRAAYDRLRATPEFAATSDSTAILRRARVDPPQARRRLGWKMIVGGVVLAASALLVVAFIRKKPAAEPVTQNSPVTAIDKGPAPSGYGVDRGYAYYTAYAEATGRELYCVNPNTDLRKMIRDIYPGPESSNPRNFMPRPDEGGIMFAATTPEMGEELWFCQTIDNGHSFDVRPVKDILPGPMGSAPRLIAVNGALTFFYATTTQAGQELWTSNGLPEQTAMVADLIPGIAGSMRSGPVSTFAGDDFYFAGNREGDVYTLNRYSLLDHTVERLADIDRGAAFLCVHGETILMRGHDLEHGLELWGYNFKTRQLGIFADTNPGPGGSDPGEVTPFLGKIIFNAYSDATGREVFITDGSAAGTRPLRDINPGPADGAPGVFLVEDRLVIFRAQDAEHGQEIWMSDGTPEGTQMVHDTRPGPDGSGPYNLNLHGGRIFYSADDGVHGEELWMAERDGAGWKARMLMDILPGPEGSGPYKLTWLDGNTGVFDAKLPDETRDVCEISVRDGTVSVKLPHSG